MFAGRKGNSSSTVEPHNRDKVEPGGHNSPNKGNHSNRSDLQLAEERRTEMSGPGSTSQKLGLNQSLKMITGLSKDLVLNVVGGVDHSTDDMLQLNTASAIDDSRGTGSGGGTSNKDNVGSGSAGTSSTLFIWESLGNLVDTPF